MGKKISKKYKSQEKLKYEESYQNLSKSKSPKVGVLDLRQILISLSNFKHFLGLEFFWRISYPLLWDILHPGLCWFTLTSQSKQGSTFWGPKPAALRLQGLWWFTKAYSQGQVHPSETFCCATCYHDGGFQWNEPGSLAWPHVTCLIVCLFHLVCLF